MSTLAAADRAVVEQAVQRLRPEPRPAPPVAEPEPARRAPKRHPLRTYCVWCGYPFRAVRGDACGDCIDLEEALLESRRQTR